MTAETAQRVAQDFIPPGKSAALLENTGTANGLFSGVTRIDAALPSYADLAPMFGADGQTFNPKGAEDLLEELLILNQTATPETVRMFASGPAVLGSASMTLELRQAIAWAEML